MSSDGCHRWFPRPASISMPTMSEERTVQLESCQASFTIHTCSTLMRGLPAKLKAITCGTNCGKQRYTHLSHGPDRCRPLAAKSPKPPAPTPQSSNDTLLPAGRQQSPHLHIQTSQGRSPRATPTKFSRAYESCSPICPRFTILKVSPEGLSQAGLIMR